MEKFDKIIAHVPHSSLNNSTLGWGVTKQMTKYIKDLTDWHVEKLFSTSNQKVEVLVFPYSRFCVDVERLIDDPLEAEGHGIIYTRHHEFTRNLPEGMSEFLMTMYTDWKALCHSCLTDNTLVIDCHAFSSSSKDVDVCIGFNDDDSKPSDEVLEFVKKKFENIGLKVKFNEPYSNSVVFGQHKSLMIEIRKDVYMDEATTDLKDPMYYKIFDVIQTIYSELTS